MFKLLPHADAINSLTKTTRMVSLDKGGGIIIHFIPILIRNFT